MSDTKIEWTDKTWNPVVGCSVVSPGCTNCYAQRQAHRLKHMLPEPNHYFDTTKVVNGNPVWTGKVALAPDHILTAPLRWKKPVRIFVNSMSDLFHESVPDEWIDRVFAVMALAPQHTFQVLSKRSKRMRDYMTRELTGPWAGRVTRVGDDNIERPETDVGFRMRGIVTDMLPKTPAEALNRAIDFMDTRDGGKGDGFFRVWPLPNVHLGVSAEDQTRADERIPDLLATPAAVRFVSAEPLLAPIDFLHLQPGDPPVEIDAMSGTHGVLRPHGGTNARLDWVIVGGESGKGARPMHPDWARSIRDQCAAANVPFFFKQHGEWLATADDNGEISYGSHERHGWDVDGSNEAWAYRVGKRRAGRLLDGREHSEFPAALSA